MTGVRTLKTQTEAFWRDEYEVSEQDLDLITGILIEAGKPQKLGVLASAIIMRRSQREKEAASRQGKQEQVYQPLGRYEVGQELIFTALDFAVGRVVAVRPGHNPKYEPFQVITVAFPERGEQREFAAAFDHPHPLNRPVEELLGGTGVEVGEEDLVRFFEHTVAQRLEPVLKAREEFVCFNGLWFLREMLPEIHIGHLNLAEAMIYEARHPLTTSALLSELELPQTASLEARLFALNHALSQDARFDNVSTSDEPIWYLRALEPKAVFARPAVLQPAFRAQGGEYLGLTMLDLVDEVGDELDDIATLTPRELTGPVQFEVIFPHLYAGTMPATSRFLRLLPSVAQRHLQITFVDTRNGQRFEAWVLPEERYVCGLGDWYTSVGMCVGGQVTVSPLEEPLTFSLAITPVRGGRSEWIRSASIQEGKLVLQMQRATLAVRCDRNTLVDVPDREALAQWMAQAEEARLSLSALVHTAFEELAKLSGRGLVHAKSIYSVVNLMRRTGAVPVFAELTRRACYDPVGDGFWVYDVSLEGSVYRTPDEMRERPLSKRTDLIKDQVVQYMGR
jgi:hypothetical protein